LKGDLVHVDKELFGDTFRRPPRLTPLEARAIRLALEYVGPAVAADAHSPLERVRRKLEETFGAFAIEKQTPEPQAGAEEGVIAELTRAIDKHRLVELEYLKEGESASSVRIVEPYTIERRLPVWYVHTWSRTSDGPRSFRIDRVRSVRVLKESFEPREGFEPESFSRARSANVWYSPEVARYAVEKGARPLVDGAALADLVVGETEWLVGEVLSWRGEAVVVEPDDLRKAVAERARQLARELRATRPAATA
jgi:predicted DNA-binding transcriptional regulator YafY